MLRIAVCDDMDAELRRIVELVDEYLTTRRGAAERTCWYCIYADFHLDKPRALDVGICNWRENRKRRHETILAANETIGGNEAYREI